MIVNEPGGVMCISGEWVGGVMCISGEKNEMRSLYSKRSTSFKIDLGGSNVITFDEVMYY